MFDRRNGPSPQDPLPARAGCWPDSPWTLIREARDGGAALRKPYLDRLLAVYYEPVRRFFGRALAVPPESLDDVTQDFFARFLQKDFLKNVRHEKSFRNFLKVACRRHYVNWLEAERVRKRPGGRRLSSLEGQDVPAMDARASEILDEELRAELLRVATCRLRERLENDGKRAYFEVFDARIGERPMPYQEIARTTGLGVYDVRNYLTAARKVFRRVLVELAAEAADDPRAELHELGLSRFL